METHSETLLCGDTVSSSARHKYGDTSVDHNGVGSSSLSHHEYMMFYGKYNTEVSGGESVSGQISQTEYSDTRHIFHTQSQENSSETRKVYSSPTESPDTRQMYSSPTESPDTRQVYSNTTESPDTRQVYPKSTESPNTRQVCHNPMESPDTCQTSQVSSSVSECLLYKEPGKTDSQESNWDINDPDIPARIEQHVIS